ncbi:unnamed protein product (macronuclear) [Paramecium tetraurelia]|uniref:Uncharacterized protein n=1 Tax=Paramecium tetraurelia TaxID=5888 RepID=A0E6B6_PARTE|nr:uncharacterized protein GSPATT00003698001 [Paramecium tetraurelia]CAK90833.1 unnamed protein product [Paramecium tetraurelia]|eukprot:XP_001458230.1 hypothetical protein (macronuclear) [Paramecium tetraurelia strain d4-2]
MSEEEYSQFLFEKHDLSKFNRYEELIDFRGFRLPDDKNKTIYLLDENGGWCDLNGCYYNENCQPSGWIVLSKDGKKFMRFNLNTEFIEEQQNIYYSNQQFDATRLEQNQQKHKNKNNNEQEQQLNQKQKQRPKQENRKQQNQSNQSNQTNQEPQKKQNQHKQKDQDREKAQNQVHSEKTKEQEQQEQEDELYVEKKDQQLTNEVNNTSDDPKTNDRDANQRNQRDRKYNNKNRKNQKKDNQNQDNNESKKYYILNINDNTLSKEDFIKHLIEECKIKQENIIDYNENILKLAQDKDAIKLYRLNKKQQTDQAQKFIVST